MKAMRVDMADEARFCSLEDAGLEEAETEPEFGYFESNGGSVYSYTDWFYDGDEQAFTFQ